MVIDPTAFSQFIIPGCVSLLTRLFWVTLSMRLTSRQRSRLIFGSSSIGMSSKCWIFPITRLSKAVEIHAVIALQLRIQSPLVALYCITFKLRSCFLIPQNLSQSYIRLTVIRAVSLQERHLPDNVRILFIFCRVLPVY